MRRILLLASMALMFAAAMALSGVAQAKTTIGGPTAAQCKNLAIKTLGKGFDPSGYTFVVGTGGNDDFTGQATAGNDVFCGFGGDDSIYTLDQGSIFLGGDGNDSVIKNYGTFYGGDGNDSIDSPYDGIVGANFGTFNGGAGDDYVQINRFNGTFNGGDGTDSITRNNYGTISSVENLP